MIKAVIFDFNGTLFQDHDINRIAWLQTLEEITKNKIDIKSFYEKRKSLHNYLIVKDAFKEMNEEANEETIQFWSIQKEIYYQNYCLEHHRNQMTNGAEELLDYLKQNNVKIGLCTSSIIENVNFYYKNVNLDRWFIKELTVYDNGKYHDKIDMYKDCAALLKENIKDIIVFEDSPKAIKEVIEAGCQKVIAIKRDDSPSLPQIKQTIEDFTKLDKSIFNE